MSQSRRAWNRTTTATVATEGGRRATAVRGPASALSSFLRERGIYAGRLNPYGRLPDDVLNPHGNNNNNDADGNNNTDNDNNEADTANNDTVDLGVDVGNTNANTIEEEQTEQTAAEPAQQQGSMMGLLGSDNGRRASKKRKFETITSEPQDLVEVTLAEAIAEAVDDDENARSGGNGSGSSSSPVTLGTKETKKAASNSEKTKKLPVKAAKKPKKRVKPDSEADDDENVFNDATARSGHSKRKGLDRDVGVKFCQRCSRKFVPSADTDDTCMACLNIPEAGKGGSRKLAELKRRRAVLVDDLAVGQILSLKEMCIKFVADNIDSVEAFGDIPENVKRGISRILSKRRYINKETVNLFIGPTEHCVELFDCARLQPDSLNQLFMLSPNVRVLHLADCGYMNDEIALNLASHCPFITSLTLKGAFLVKDTAFEILFSSEFSQNLEHLVLENTAKFGEKGMAALATKCKNLKSLSLSKCSNVTGAAVLLLGMLNKLESLELIELGNIVDDDLVGVLNLIGSKLTKLSLDGCTQMTDKVLLEGICKYCSNLQHLSIRDNELLTDEGLLAYLNTREIGVTPLKSLDLHRLYNLTDSTINSVICHHGASLKRLVLNGLDDLSEIALKAVVEGCPVIRELDLSWVRNFDDTLFEVMVAKCRFLKIVKVYGCNRLSIFSLGKRFVNVHGEVIRVVGNEFD